MEGHAWSTSDSLLALIFDQLAAISWQLGGGKGPRPKRLPRPWDRDTTRIGGNRTFTPAELDLLLGRG